jgi:hypothetical protein
VQKSLQAAFPEMNEKINAKPLGSLIVVNILLNLFFIQGLRAFVPGIYSSMFHVVFGQEVVKNLLSLLSFLFIFLPGLSGVLIKIRGKTGLMYFSLWVVTLLRLALAFHLPPVFETVGAGLILAFWGFYISSFLSGWLEQKDGIAQDLKVSLFIVTFLCALLIDYFIRTLGLTQDLSLLPPGIVADYWYLTQYLWLLVQVLLTGIVIYLVRKYFPQLFMKSEAGSSEKKETGGKLFIGIGLGMFLFLLFNLLLYPNVIAMYTTTSYDLNNILSIAGLTLMIYLFWIKPPEFFLDFKKICVTNGVLLISLLLFLFFGTTLQYIASILIQIALLALYVNFFNLVHLIGFFKGHSKHPQNGTTRIGVTITVAFFANFIFNVLHIFSNDWAYTVRFFKNWGPPIILITGVIFAITSVLGIYKLQKQHLNGGDTK